MINLESLSLQELLEIKENIDDVISRKKEQLLKENNVSYTHDNEDEFFRKILEENHTSLEDNDDYWNNHKQGKINI